MTATLDAELMAAAGRPFADLDATTALDVADKLRAVVAVLPPATPRDAHLAGLLTEAAELVERRAGIT
jgi:hypothetical protein